MVQLIICSMLNSNAEVRVIAVYFDLDLSAMSLRQRIAKEDFEICNHLGSAAAHNEHESVSVLAETTRRQESGESLLQWSGMPDGRRA